MRGRLVVLDQWQGREAAALIVDGGLQDLLIAPADMTLTPGTILRGVVGRPLKGQGGAFIRLPDGARGFLRQISGLAPGQPVIVQVSGTAEPGKAAPVTRRVLFKSRLAIVTPAAPGINVSRRIRDRDRQAALVALGAAAMTGTDHGLILRSACIDADDADIAADITAQCDLADTIMADRNGAPELLLAAPGPHEIAWRDWSDPWPDTLADNAGAFVAHSLPELIADLQQPEVSLPGGATLVIEPTRALIAVDVNTGTDTSPAAGLKANIAAARDLPRQLRLRGLGGQVTVDFAPMPRKDRTTVEQVLRAAFKGEAAETTLAGWTPLGCYELQRKRDREPLGGVV